MPTFLSVLARARVGALLVSSLTSLAVVLVLGPPAEAKVRKWNSRDVPLTVSDGGAAKGAGYGTWQVGTTVNGTRSQAYGYLLDRAPKNGYKVYFELFTQTNAGLCVAPEYTSCSSSYYAWKSQFSNFDKETWDRDKWSADPFYASTDLSSSGSYARARMRVSESNKGPDSHSKSTYTKGNRY